MWKAMKGRGSTSDMQMHMACGREEVINGSLTFENLVGPPKPHASIQLQYGIEETPLRFPCAFSLPIDI